MVLQSAPEGDSKAIFKSRDDIRQWYVLRDDPSVRRRVLGMNGKQIVYIHEFEPKVAFLDKETFNQHFRPMSVADI